MNKVCKYSKKVCLSKCSRQSYSAVHVLSIPSLKIKIESKMREKEMS